MKKKRMVQNIMKISLKTKLFSLFLMFFFLHLNVVHAAVPDLPGRAVPLEGIFTIPTGSNSYVEGTDIAVITRPINNQVGAIFSTEPNKMDLSEDFSASMLLYFGNEGTRAADGMTFVMHGDVASVTNFNGIPGDQLGIYGALWFPWDMQPRILKNSFAVEFDTYFNGDGLDKGLERNSDNGHVAWSFPNERSSYQFDEILPDVRLSNLIHNNIYYPTEPLSNDQWHTFTVDWDASSRSLRYSFDGNIVSVEIPFEIFGTNNVFWGFTGSTGGQVQESAVAFTQVPGLVNLDKRFEVVNNDNVDINGGTIKSGETATVKFDLSYIGGHQDLIDPEVIFDLDENTLYKVGSLKLNGLLIDDTQFISNGYSYSFSNLSLANPNAQFSFEIENINDTEENRDSSVSAHVDAKNFFSEILWSDFIVERRLNILSLKSVESSIEFSGSEMDLLSSLSNAEKLQKIIDKAGVSASASDEDTEDIIITNYYDGAFLNLNRLTVNTMYSFELIATRGSEKSETIVIDITHIPGSVSFQSYPSTIEFDEELGTSSSKLFKAIPNIELSVSDTRTYNSPWTLQVSASDLQNSDSKILQGHFKYLIGGESIIINGNMQTILTGKQGLTGPSILEISNYWSNTAGLVFETSNANYLGTYTGTMNWLLLDTP